FHEGVKDHQYRECLAVADEEGADAPLSLYFHLPFCERRCRFCGCHVVATKRREVADEYLSYLFAEIDLIASLLTHRRRVVQLHWGGGTPTYLSPEAMEQLFARISGPFRLDEGAELAVEVDPRVTTRAHLDLLARLGFNRLSLGVQDFDPKVQEAIGRGQTHEQTRELLTAARQIGFSEGINFDLVYGLPLQSVDSFRVALDKVVALGPDRLAVYSFAYVPWIRANQRKIDENELPTAEQKLELYFTAYEQLTNAGYEPIGMDHFSMPDDELAQATREGRLARNFMGYTVKPASAALAFGISAISDLASGYFQNVKKLSTYYRALDEGRLPIDRGYLLDRDDELRRYVITEIMCNFRVDKRRVEERFGVDFDDYFALSLKKLDELREAGFVEEPDGLLRVSSKGRLFVRNVAMAFDRYLDEKLKQRPMFSRTV
ncbi:MAG: oxygen-independent coproporphyrinogen III oxidase, partial [Acidobacteriota bacterium]